MFENLLYLPANAYQNTHSGRFISKFSYDVNQVTGAATEVFVTLVKDSLTIVALLGVMIYYNWKLTLISLVILPIISLVVRWVSQRMRRLNSELQTKMGDMTHVVDESVKGYRVVKLFDGYPYELKRFADIANWIRRFQNKIVITGTFSVSLIQLMTALALALIVFIAAKQNSGTQNLSVGEFAAFFGSMGLLFSPIKRLTKVNDQLQRGLAAAATIFELIDMPRENEEGVPLTHPVTGQLTFDNVSFRYPGSGKHVLKEISFYIEPGETIALVGQSGSGKTTLCNLIPRFFELEAGAILLDATPISTLRLQDLRRQIALVSQDVVLFNDTIAANIIYGTHTRLDWEPDRVMRVIQQAGAEEFIDTLPEGLETQVGENGLFLSGGQRQRIAIARALYKDAPILLLDEATSALDSETEKRVQDALETLKKGRTTLIIAHRLSTIEKADRILVLSQGKVVESGTHAELMAKKGAYYQLQLNPCETPSPQEPSDAPEGLDTDSTIR
jgi:subfamily B ATP-binding cassette protein MsbA